MVSSCFTFGLLLVPSWFPLVPFLVFSWSRLGSFLVPSWFSLRCLLVASWFPLGSLLVPSSSSSRWARYISITAIVLWQTIAPFWHFVKEWWCWLQFLSWPCFGPPFTRLPAPLPQSSTATSSGTTTRCDTPLWYPYSYGSLPIWVTF